MKELRIALKNVRLLAALVLAGGATCVLVPGTSVAFSVGSLTGGYGCLARATTNDSSGTLSGISELMRLGFDGAGKVKGKIVLNNSGEVCNIVVSGTYSVGFGGVGVMNLTWNTATGDADGDLTCSTLNGLVITQHTDLVVVSGGGEFDFQSADDFLTAPTAMDGGSLVDLKNPLVGSCKKQ